MVNKTGTDKTILDSRDDILKKRNKNLWFLLKKRYDWIKQYIEESESGLELGSGAGHSKMFMEGNNYITSDICDLPWINKTFIDAQNTPFEDESFDYIFMNNVLHHLDKPALFFKEAERLLKKGGRVIIFETYSSISLQSALKLLRHEHCNNKADILDPDYSLLSYSKGLQDGNNSVGRKLFESPDHFLARFDHFEMLHKSYSEHFIFLNSGGVYKKYLYLPLNSFILNTLDKVDEWLVKIAPNIFALAIRVVLMKK